MVPVKNFLAVLLVLLVAQAAQARNLLQVQQVPATTCKYSKCPAGYYPATVPFVNMCPLCIKPANLPCGTTNGKPYCCGGASGIICPSVACAYSESYSISGSNSSCAIAKSTVSAYAFSNSTYNFVKLYTPVLKNYCTAPTTASIASYVASLVSAYSEAVARTLIQYNTYVCECAGPTISCPGGKCALDTEAYSVVSADVVSVARAQAQALQVALAEVYADCFNSDDQLLASASALARSVASDVALALDTLYKTGVSSSDSTINCKKQVTFNQTKQAVAKAVACTYVKLFAMARDACTPGTAYACSSTIALSGTFPADFQGCAASVQCKPEIKPIVDDGTCKLADEVVAPLGFTAVPVPTNPPAPDSQLVQLEFQYPDDAFPAQVNLSSSVQALQVPGGWSSSSWCGSNPLVFYTQGASSITFTFPAGTTVFATRLMCNFVGTYTFYAQTTDGTIITDPTYVSPSGQQAGSGPSNPLYVGFYVKSWFLKSITITQVDGYDFAFADTYISDTVVETDIAV